MTGDNPQDTKGPIEEQPQIPPHREGEDTSASEQRVIALGDSYQPPRDVKIEGEGHNIVYSAKNLVVQNPRALYIGVAALAAAGILAAVLAFRKGEDRTVNLFPDFYNTTNQIVASEQTPYGMPSQMTPIATSQSDLECVVTREQLRNAVKDESKLDKLAEVFANSYSGVTPDKATSTQQLSLENAKRYLKQLTDGKRSAADKSKGISANPESVSMRLLQGYGLTAIQVDFEETNSEGQIVSKTGKDAQKFWLVPETASTYAKQFCSVFQE